MPEFLLDLVTLMAEAVPGRGMARESRRHLVAASILLAALAVIFLVVVASPRA
jgi:hypothetical protein